MKIHHHGAVRFTRVTDPHHPPVAVYVELAHATTITAFPTTVEAVNPKASSI